MAALAAGPQPAGAGPAALAGWGGLALAAVFVALLALLARLLLALKRSKRALESELAERTAQNTASRRQLEAIFNTLPDMIWLKDAEGVYLDCNPQFERLYGAKRADILGKTDYDFTDRLQADSFRDNDRKAMHARQPRANEEWVTCAGESEPLLLETIKTPLIDTDGRLVGVLGIARDITARKRTEESLRESETRLTVALDATQVGIWDWDIAHDRWYASPTYFSMLGYEPTVGAADRKVWLDRLHPEDRVEAQRRIANVLRGNEVVYDYDARIRHADGSFRWCSTRGRVVSREADGLATRMLGVRIDIHELKTAEERIHWLAHYDLLTGLPNRTQLDHRMAHAIEAAQRTQSPLALIFLDLDRFKNVNDTLGHRVGDTLLIALAQRMRDALRDEDIVARQGGDEFVLALPGTDANAAAHVAKKLIESLARPCQIELHELVVTVSAGIAVYPDDAGDFETLFKCADIAMYRAKREGRNAYRFFTSEMQQRSARVLQIENALRRALERNEFWLAYQPQMALADGRVIGAEALLRWQHPELGAVSPAEFIGIAEDSGQIIEIGEWVLRTAVRQMRRWMDRGLPAMTIAVNLSALQFRQPDLPRRVTQILEEARLPGQYLELELTEGVAMDDPLGAIAVMNHLHEHQIRLSIDDFGTGYSSLSYLKRFPVYKLKIDQSFVRNLSQDPEDKAIVGAIVSLARSLGLQTIAEGVETEAQFAFVREQGCDQAQGYWFSKPLAAEAFEALVRSRSAEPAFGSPVLHLSHPGL
ncbi:MAG TPA: EAL domain-containing protein [Ideonella sp.]|nr:EAL domain-containing protein [Ideonella sp.]